MRVMCYAKTETWFPSLDVKTTIKRAREGEGAEIRKGKRVGAFRAWRQETETSLRSEERPLCSLSVCLAPSASWHRAACSLQQFCLRLQRATRAAVASAALSERRWFVVLHVRCGHNVHLVRECAVWFVEAA